MHALYLVSVYLHILAAIAWVGGMLFLVLVVVPWLRASPRSDAATLLRETGARFRNVGWTCFAVVLVTGSFNLWMRGVRFEHLTDAAWLASPFGRTVGFKLALFIAVLAVSAVHDFVVGPRAVEAMQQGPGSAAAERARQSASRLGRTNALLALLLVLFGVMIVRGMPF